MAQRGRPKKQETKPAITKAQLSELHELETALGEIRRKLFKLEEESETVGKIMFNVGIVFKLADDAEDKLCNLLEDLDPDSYSINF